MSLKNSSLVYLSISRAKESFAACVRLIKTNIVVFII